MIGILLINLGTPDSPSTRNVRRYLREFLSDPRVIDIPALPRWLLVNLLIAPFRAPRSAQSYRKIWRRDGSPLLHHTRELARAVAKDLGEDYHVEVGMRYGKPGLAAALETIRSRGVQEIRVFPLYPQYAASSTGSSEAEVFRLKKKIKGLPPIQFLPPFFDHSGFLQSFAELGGAPLKKFQPDHILFSFHGLPVRQILKGDVGGRHCLQSPDCCEKIIPANGLCYRAHCFQTARGIAALLSLKKSDYTICFQSRLGRTPWIQPFTDVLLHDLAKAGKKRIAVFCPSFVADCLETLEEIGIRERRRFIEAGGEDLLLIPSLNVEPSWVKTVSSMIRGEADI